ncbi:uncharacterized protein LOC116139097 [Pistacia vera]|uniref:uncharacterized protein LOC116139097 n=1 Tax=Pistacia vera TaxID=55513 RepID=UPI001263C37E|nr:uncharacterized protein LOC116139097 [Pistacia vera]
MSRRGGLVKGKRKTKPTDKKSDPADRQTVRNKSCCPLQIKEWKELKEHEIDHMWTIIKEKFVFEEVEGRKEAIFGHMNALYRDYRYKMKKNILIRNQLTNRLKNKPKLERSNKNKTNRSKRSMPPYTGTKSYARLRRQMVLKKAENGEGKNTTIPLEGTSSSLENEEKTVVQEEMAEKCRCNADAKNRRNEEFGRWSTPRLRKFRYYLSLRTVLEMLNDRGYDIPSSQLSRSLAEFRSIFETNLLERLRFDFPLRSKPSKKITDLLVNITKHILQPKHEILTAAEKHILLKKYMLEDEQLPRMLENDAIARYYGLEKGQLVKLTYSDGFADSLETYRCIQ